MGDRVNLKVLKSAEERSTKNCIPIKEKAESSNPLSRRGGGGTRQK